MVSDELLRQYEVIRRTGQTNMMMQSNVRELAEMHGFDELVETIDNDEYAELLQNYDAGRAESLVE